MQFLQTYNAREQHYIDSALAAAGVYRYREIYECGTDI